MVYGDVHTAILRASSPPRERIFEGECRNVANRLRVCFKMQGDAISSGFACISRRFSAGLVGLSQGKSTPKCRQRRRNCTSGILETHSNIQAPEDNSSGALLCARGICTSRHRSAEPEPSAHMRPRRTAIARPRQALRCPRNPSLADSTSSRHMAIAPALIQATRVIRK